MRRNLILLAALVVVVVSYAFYWYSVADLVRRGILDWSAARRAEGFTVGWDRYVVSGFPFVLRVSIEQPVFGQSGIEPGYAAQAPLLVGEARPWALDQWRVTAAYGARLAIQPGPARPAVTITAAALAGTVQPRQDGDTASHPGTAVTLAIDRIAIVGQSQPSITRAELETVIPAHRVASHLETWLTASVNLIGVTLPQAVQPLGDTIDRLTATVAVKGDIPAGPHREALAAWRDDGGTLEIGSFDLGWGKLQLGAKGTLAL